MAGAPLRPGLLYGINPALEALRAGLARRLYISLRRREKVQELLRLAQGVEVRWVPQEFFRGFPKGHQSVAVQLKREPLVGLKELLELPGPEPALFVVLDRVSDPRNLGAIIRTAYLSGAHAVVLQRHRAAALSPEAYKASAGAALLMPICVLPNVKTALDAMLQEGITIFGAEAQGGLYPWEADLTQPLALLMGSEGEGLREVLKRRCQALLSLPMKGPAVGSLNVSVAAGMLLYEILRQRRRKIEKGAHNQK